jgi:pimeloyl-ACP methyl ester carboxylesterase
MTTFVLVHGGWHGAWAWESTAAELTARGHEAVAVELPAEDPTAGAAAYAAAVGAAVDAAGREEVVLVGHSLAGLTLPLVAAARPEVRHVVYLAAMLPDPGRSVDEQAAAGDRQTRRGLGRHLVRHPDGSSSWDPAAARRVLYPDSPAEVAARAAARLRRQHWRVTAERTPLEAWPDVPSTYLLCTEDQVIDGDWARRAVPTRLGVEPVPLPGDHSPFLARPAELADLLTH